MSEESNQARLIHAMDALAAQKGSLTLLDLPKAVLQDILSQCGPASTRCLHCVHVRNQGRACAPTASSDC